MGPQPSRPETATKWEADDASKTCRLCKAELRTFSRHHCRECGSLVCGQHSSNTKTVPGYPTPQRVCDKCFRGEAPPENSINTVANFNALAGGEASAAAAQGDPAAKKPHQQNAAVKPQHQNPSRSLAEIPASKRRNHQIDGGGVGGPTRSAKCATSCTTCGWARRSTRWWRSSPTLRSRPRYSPSRERSCASR